MRRPMSPATGVSVVPGRSTSPPQLCGYSRAAVRPKPQTAACSGAVGASWAWTPTAPAVRHHRRTGDEPPAAAGPFRPSGLSESAWTSAAVAARPLGVEACSGSGRVSAASSDRTPPRAPPSVVARASVSWAARVTRSAEAQSTGTLTTWAPCAPRAAATEAAQAPSASAAGTGSSQVPVSAAASSTAGFHTTRCSQPSASEVSPALPAQGGERGQDRAERGVGAEAEAVGEVLRAGLLDEVPEPRLLGGVGRRSRPGGLCGGLEPVALALEGVGGQGQFTAQRVGVVQRGRVQFGAAGEQQARGEQGGAALVALAPHQRCGGGRRGIGDAVEGHRRQRGVGAQFEVRGDAEGFQGARAVAEADRVAHVPPPVGGRAQVVAFGEASGHVGDDGQGGRGVGDARRDLFELVEHRVHAGGVEGVADPQAPGAPSAPGEDGGDPLDFVAVAGEDDRRGAVEGGDAGAVPLPSLPSLSSRSVRTSSSVASTAVIAPPSGSACISRPRAATRAQASGRVRTPAACAAVSSPMEWPMRASGRAPQEWTRAWAAVPTANSAAWV